MPIRLMTRPLPSYPPPSLDTLSHGTSTRDLLAHARSIERAPLRTAVAESSLNEPRDGVWSGACVAHTSFCVCVWRLRSLARWAARCACGTD